MATPIIKLVLMMAPSLVVRLFSAITRRDFDVRSAAAIGLGMVFIFTGVGHFIATEPMAQMLPSWVLERTLLVYVTGVLEWAMAVGFFVPQSRRFTGWLAAAMLVLFFPVNIYAAIHEIPMGEQAWGPAYLLIRTPLQAIIVCWVYGFTIRQHHPKPRADAPPTARRCDRSWASLNQTSGARRWQGMHWLT